MDVLLGSILANISMQSIERVIEDENDGVKLITKKYLKNAQKAVKSFAKEKKLVLNVKNVIFFCARRQNISNIEYQKTRYLVWYCEI